MVASGIGARCANRPLLHAPRVPAESAAKKGQPYPPWGSTFGCRSDRPDLHVGWDEELDHRGKGGLLAVREIGGEDPVAGRSLVRVPRFDAIAIEWVLPATADAPHPRPWLGQHPEGARLDVPLQSRVLGHSRAGQRGQSPGPGSGRVKGNLIARSSAFVRCSAVGITESRHEGVARKSPGAVPSVCFTGASSTFS